MQFYIIYLKELKEQFNICPLIVQLVEVDMIWDLEQYENNYSAEDVIGSLLNYIFNVLKYITFCTLYNTAKKTKKIVNILVYSGYLGTIMILLSKKNS